MSRILIFLMFITISYPAKSQIGELIAEIELDPEVLADKYEYFSTEFMSARKTSLSKNYTFPLNSLIDPEIKNIQKSQRKRILIIAENGAGEKLVFTYSEIDEEITKLMPQLIFKPVTGSIGDTVKIGDVEGQRTKVDMDKFEEEFEIAVRKRIYLQMKNMNKKEKKRIFSNMSVIFPTDSTPKRWISNVKSIKIYLPDI